VRRLAIWAVVAVCAACATIGSRRIASVFAQAVPQAAQRQDWPYYGGGPEGDHYSPLAQINRSNVKQLAVAWSFDTQETGEVDENRLAKVLQELVDLTPRGIREHLGLNKPIYARTTAYGHFGRKPDADGGFSWERLDLVDSLRAALH